MALGLAAGVILLAQFLPPDVLTFLPHRDRVTVEAVFDGIVCASGLARGHLLLCPRDLVGRQGSRIGSMNDPAGPSCREGRLSRRRWKLGPSTGSLRNSPFRQKGPTGDSGGWQMIVRTRTPFRWTSLPGRSPRSWARRPRAVLGRVAAAAEEAAAGSDEPQSRAHEPAVAVEESAGDDSARSRRWGSWRRCFLSAIAITAPLTAARAAELMRGVEPGEIGGLIERVECGVTRGTPALTSWRKIPTATASPCGSRFIRSASSFTGGFARPGFRKRRSTCWPSWPISSRSPQNRSARSAGSPAARCFRNWSTAVCCGSSDCRGKRRTVQYFTTDRFLQLFGLQTLADLPQSEELDRQ